MSEQARPRAAFLALGAACGLALVMRTTLRAFIAPVGDETGWLLSSLPAWHLLLVGLLGGAAGAFYLSRWKKASIGLLLPFAAVGALATAIFVPGIYRLWPFLAGFSGRFLDFALVVAALGLAVRFLLARKLRVTPSLVFGVALVVFLAVGIKTSRDVGLSGDEPHYLLITDSLLRDSDLAVQNNYGAEDYRSFFGGTLGPHLAEGSPYSIHGVGLPVLLLPGFALGGLTGVLLTEALLGAALVAVTFTLCRRITGDGASALVGAVSLGLSAPGLFLAVAAYPELPAALVVALVAWRLSLHEERLSPLWGLVVGALPLFHVKYVPLTLVLAAALLYRFRAPRRRLVLVSGFLGAAAVFLAFGFAMTGSFDPTAGYGRQRIFWSAIPLGLAGLLFDQEFGLIANAPIYFLGFAGFRNLEHRAPLVAWLGCAVFVSVALPGAAHPLWSGGTSPPARFLFPATPLLAAAVSALVASRKGLAAWAPSLLAVSLAAAGAMWLLTPQPLYLNGRDGASNLLVALSSAWALADYVPSLVRAAPHDILWAVGLVVLLLLSLFAPSARLLGRLPPVGLALVLTFASDRTLALDPDLRREPLEARWSLDVLHGLGERPEATFVALPSRERLRATDVMARVSLPLEPVARDGDPRHWWSRPYALPPGVFHVEGIEAEGAAVANGDGMLDEGTTRFQSAVRLERFRLRARSLLSPPRLRLVQIGSGSGSGTREPGLLAFHSVALGNGVRLHALDENSYLDPVGFWIRPERSARFYLETPDEGRSLELAAGPIETWIRLEVSGHRIQERFRLTPHARKAIAIAPGLFSVRSESGFTPREHDPRSHDHRRLGVLLATPPAFDLGR